MKNDSACKKNILCDFSDKRDLDTHLIEKCVNCGKKVVYKKVGGDVDPAKYLRDHLRDTLQPYGRTGKLFRTIYGLDNVKAHEKEMKGRRSKKQLQEEWEETRKDALRYVKVRTLGSLGPRGTNWN